MRTLASPTAFNFNEDQLCRAYRLLYSDQMVVVTNVKPSVGELDLKFDQRSRHIQFVKIQLSESLKSMSDVRFSFNTT